MNRFIALLALTAFSSTAQAQSWSDFDAAFELFPCSDGWAGCVVSGEPIQPDLKSDGSGVPRPSTMRVDWFSLEATDAFSPFVGLSEYTGELRWQSEVPEEIEVAEVEEPVEVNLEDIVLDEAGQAAVAEAAAANVAQERAAEERAAAERAATEALEKEAEARRQAEEQAKRQRDLESRAAAANAAEKDRLQAEAAEAARQAAAAEAARKAAEAESKRREEERQARLAAEAAAAAEAEAKRKAEDEARRKAEDEARRKAEEEAAERKAAAEAAAAVKAAEEAANKEAVVAKVAAPAGPGTCGLDELVRLEPMAMLGKLSDGQISACEGTLASVPKMTDKGKVSRVLMVNAFSKGDKSTWEQLVKRHLDEIDQSDPDLCYKYALHLSKKGPSRASGVIRWVNVALENRTVWSGDTYTSRVYSLHKLRAAASQSLWQAAEDAYNGDPSPGNQDKIDKNRSMTKVNAREWYEYAKSAGKDTTKALQLCMSAAGTKDYCEAG